MAIFEYLPTADWFKSRKYFIAILHSLVSYHVFLYNTTREADVGSFLFWYDRIDSKENNNEVTATLNFNLWSDCGWKCGSYLDIGLKLTNLKVAQKLHLYIPFAVDIKNITDLGHYMINGTNSSELCSAIFNEDLTMRAEEQNSKVGIASNGKGEYLRIFELLEKSDLTLLPKYEGTVITIDATKICNTPERMDKDWYIRSLDDKGVR